MILLLNKCDLVPPPAVDSWLDYFGRLYPDMHVLPVSAGSPDATAHAVLQRVLACQVERAGQRVPVAELVKASVEEIIAASKARNVHKKRGLAPAARGAGRGAAADDGSGAGSDDGNLGSAESDSGADDGGSDSSSLPLPLPKGAAAARAASAAAGVGRGATAKLGALRVDESGSDDDWGKVKGTKARKMDAVRRKRQHRMHAEQPAELAPAGPTAGKGRPAAGASAATAAGNAATQGPRGTLDEDDGSSSGAEFENDSDNDNADLEALMAEDFDSGDDSKAASARGSGVGSARQSSGGVSAGAAGGRPQPVVVAVVGEPNVGKSSTMNALLGTHKVRLALRFRHSSNALQACYLPHLPPAVHCYFLYFSRAGQLLPNAPPGNLSVQHHRLL